MFRKLCLERVSQNIKLEMDVSKQSHRCHGNGQRTNYSSITSPSIFMDAQ